MTTPIKVEQATKRVEMVANGGTINGTYKQMPMAALVAFRADLLVMIDAIRSRMETDNER